jgi:ATP-dependent DNA ligase
MLAVPIADPRLPAGSAAEPKWDGFRSTLVRPANGRVVLRSRRAADLTAAFPEIAAAADADLPADTVLDGELVIWHEGRLAFELLQSRLNSTRADASRQAARHPAHYVAFDLLRLGEQELLALPYAERRAALERLFADRRLGGHITLSPSTTDQQTVDEWLTWSAVGIEGVVFKSLRQPYLPGRRGWRKYRARDTTEAVIAAITGSLAGPRSLLLGRYDAAHRLHYVGSSTTLPAAAARALAPLLTAADERHPWRGQTFPTARGGTAARRVILVQPDLVAEVGAVSPDSTGRWHHPAHFRRIRSDLTTAETPILTNGDQ